jgi:hypothetical protein
MAGMAIKFLVSAIVRAGPGARIIPEIQSYDRYPSPPGSAMRRTWSRELLPRKCGTISRAAPNR